MSNAIRSDYVEFTFKINDDPLKKLSNQANSLGEKFKNVSGDDAFNKLKNNITKCKNPLTSLSESFEKTKNNLKKFGTALNSIDTKSLKKVDEKLTSITKKLGTGLVSAAKKAGVAMGAIGGALGTVVAQSVQAYADYQQFVGGVETLFKDSASIVQKYANNAYKTAGLSANQYMETVTGFSASLLQSLDGDTAKAAKYADMAITDMSDNAAKLGTSMESLQFAYSGFAKSNFTMLDNLKLGYSGTKEEMQRLLTDAEKLSGKKFDISSYADIVEAIHLIQENMDIAGTTAKEADKTISGSLASVKSAWSNLLPAFVQGGDALDQCITNLIDSAKTFAKNIIPAVDGALSNILGRLGGFGQSIQKVIDKIKSVATNSEKMGKIKSIFDSLKSLVENVSGIFAGLVGHVVDFCTQESTLNTIKGIFDGINDAVTWCKDHFDGLSTAVLAVGSGFLAVVGCVKALNAIMAIQKGIQIASTVASYALAAARGTEVTATTAATAAQLGLNTAILANPVTWIVIAIIAAIAALVAIIVVVVKHWDQIKAAAVTCWEAIKSAWGVASEWISTTIIEPIKNFFTNLWYFIVGVAVSIWNGLVSVFSPIATWVNSNVIQPVVNFFTNLWHSIVNIVSQVWSTICSIWGKIASWVNSNIIEPIKTFFSGLWDSVSGGVSSVKEAITGAFSSAYEKVVGVWEGITGFFKGIWDGIKGTVNKLINKGKEALGVETDVKNQGKKHAWGGLMTSPHWGLVAEDGAEMIIPLSKDKRSRGLSLWQQAGNILGVNEGLARYTPEATASTTVRETYEGGDTYSPTFNLTINNQGDDREMEYKVKKWLKEGMDDIARGLSRRNPRMREV